MGLRYQVFLMLLSAHILAVMARTDSNDFAALKALQSSWKNLPPNWKGSDPCGSVWEGISCNNSRVTAITLGGIGLTGSQFGDISSLTVLELLDLSNNVGLKGTLPSSIGNLKNLTTLILVGCGFYGPIPETIGSLQQLVYLSLNSNNFTGQIPPSIGKLSKLSWLDLSENQLTGNIPVSSETAPGLDWLLNAKHFHLSKNKLSGVIPTKLFNSSMKLIHVILDNNQLVGTIPNTLGDVKSLEIIRLDSNALNESVPSTFINLPNVTDLYLSNNNLIGPIPNLKGMDVLSYVDISNNSFSESAFPLLFTSLQSLTTLLMEKTQLVGQIPIEFFGLPQLQKVVLSNNQLDGSLDVGESVNRNMTLDLRNNLIEDFKQKSGYNMELTLVGNPICEGKEQTEKYCTVPELKSSFSLNNCTATSCNSGKTTSPNCKCSHPYTGTLHFFSASFSDLGNLSYYRTLQGYLMTMFLSNKVPVEAVNVSNPSLDVYSYLQYRLQVFPAGQDSFNRTAIGSINFLLNRQSPPLQYFGPFFFIEESYCCFAGDNKSSNTGVIIGVSVGICVLVVLILCAGIYAFRKWRRARTAMEKNNPFASWDPNKGNGSVPEIKGARWFLFEELRKLTDDFAESNCIGYGGYGKVYRGALISGQLVAIKRAQQGSLQGALEFKTEIELLSRIHHKNVVSLVGFCYEQGEQMLVYEYIQNGTLRESLSGKSGIQLDWRRRLTIALDAARGLSYLHELANPPIIHRDIKSNNILLGENLNAKVADFGLSKLMGDSTKGYVTTQVKGTLGYMDPEYYMTQQLTEKSDVYSFGVVLLELATARAPIERGKHIVRLVQEAFDNSKDLHNLYQIVDPKIGPGPKLGGLEKFIDLAMRCVTESAADRPTMGEVVREIENIMQLASSKNNSETEFNSSSFEDTTERSQRYSSYGSNAFVYSGGFSPIRQQQR